MPFWTAQLLTSAKSFVDNPILGSASLNARGLHVARIRAAAAVTALRRRAMAHRLSAEDLAAYERDGFIVKSPFLPQDQFNELLEQVHAWRGTVREHIQGDTITRLLALNRKTLERLPAVARLIETPEWNDPIQYIGSRRERPLNCIQTILTHRRDAAPDPQLKLHADTFHATVKAWLFLHDVADDAAPFVYVPGSHRMTPARLEWERRTSMSAATSACRLTARGSFRIDESELAELGLPPPRRLAVPANTLVIADTSGFHARGSSARPTCRVDVWAQGRNNPFVPWFGPDPWSVGKLGDYRMPLYWSLMDRLERRGLGVAHWKEVGDRPLFED